MNVKSLVSGALEAGNRYFDQNRIAARLLSECNVAANRTTTRIRQDGDRPVWLRILKMKARKE